MRKTPLPAGMRIFLYAVLDIIKFGKTEKCDYIEEIAEKGLATALYKKYSSYFEAVGFNCDNLEGIDTFFQDSLSIIAGDEFRKYSCQEYDGLFLVVKLVLNEIN